MVDVSNIINVNLLPEPQAAAADNPNVVAMVTSAQYGPLNSDNRFKIYSSADSVATDFGFASKEAASARVFFGTRPNAVNAGGVFAVAYWRGQEETTDDTAAVLEGAQLTESTVVDALADVDDGSFDIDIDGVTENVSGLDFVTAVTLEDIAGVIDTALTGGTAEVSNSRIVITSATTGGTSTISFVTDPGSGTFIGDVLKITDGSGATATDGEASQTLTAETQVEALSAILEDYPAKGITFLESAPSEREDVASYAQSNDILVYEVFDDPSNLEVDKTNTVWIIMRKGQDRYRMLYSKAGNRDLAVSYMARQHTSNFNAGSTAITMNLKELNVSPEMYTASEFSKAQTVGLDIYTTSKNVPVVITSPANDFSDNIYNLIAFVDFLKTSLFNVLKLTTTKVAQTRQGVNQEITAAEQTCEQFRTAGVIAPGTWTLPDTFGNEEAFRRNIQEKGYYVIAEPLADQTASDRQNRISPAIRVAIKNAGAIHKADVIVNFNK